MRAKSIACGSLLGLLLAVAAHAAVGDASLVQAVKKSDIAAVRTLIQAHVDVNAAEPDGTTALHWAASRGDAPMVKLLIRAGSRTSAANRYGVTPLLLACETGGAATVEALLGAGADANSALPEGETAVMVAARSGKADVIQLLAARGARVDAKEGWRGQTALMWAAAENHPDVIKTLVAFGADIHARTEGGFTPMLFAARAGKVDALKALIELGASPNDSVQPAPEKPVGNAVPYVGNNAGVVGGGGRSMGSVTGDGTSALILAMTNKRWELATFLLEHGADPNDERVGWTPLHELAYMRRPNIGKGLPPQEETEYVDTLEVARTLIEHGANVNARQTKERRDGARNELNRVGATPLLLAAKHADVAFMQVLAAHGADPRVTTAAHTTVLMAAAGVGVFNVGESAGTNEQAFEATKVAYQLGSADVNAADDTGWTALHGAAKRGSNDIVQFLVDRGASNFEATTTVEGWTPLRIADGVLVGATVKRADETAALLRRLMIAHGLQPPVKVVNDVAESVKPRR